MRYIILKLFPLFFLLILHFVRCCQKYVIETKSGKSHLGRLNQIKPLRRKYYGSMVNNNGIRESDYQDNQESISQIDVYIGSEAQLKCKSSEPITNCLFISPMGEYFNVGAGLRYQNGRIECLCSVEEYDTTKVCGIIIKGVKQQDKGEWSCKIDVEVGGRTLSGGTKIKLQPYDLPSQTTDKLNEKSSEGTSIGTTIESTTLGTTIGTAIGATLGKNRACRFAAFLPESETTANCEIIKGFTLYVTCDGMLMVNWDGVLQYEDKDENRKWTDIIELIIPRGTNRLSISCKNMREEKGILASTFISKLRTDKSWSCVGDLAEVMPNSNNPEKDWTNVDFDILSHFSQAKLRVERWWEKYGHRDEKQRKLSTASNWILPKKDSGTNSVFCTKYLMHCTWGQDYDCELYEHEKIGNTFEWGFW